MPRRKQLLPFWAAPLVWLSPSDFGPKGRARGKAQVYLGAPTGGAEPPPHIKAAKPIIAPLMTFEAKPYF